MRLNSHDNTTKDYGRARDLRNNASSIENKLWGVLREAAKAAGFKFRRQQAVHPYIADFACMSIRLLVEVDGDTHADTLAYDRARDKILQRLGFSILRFTNDEVIKNVDGVVMMIIERASEIANNYKCESLLISPLPNPPHEGEGSLSRTSRVG